MISQQMDQIDAARQYGFLPDQLAAQHHPFMPEVSVPVQQEVQAAGAVADGWVTPRTDEPASSNNNGGEAPMAGAPQFGYGAFAGRRGSFDWMSGKERAAAHQLSPMVDRPSSVGPYGLPGRSFRSDRLEPSPTIRRARSQYHSATNSRATSPIPIPPSFRPRPTLVDDGGIDFLAGESSRRGSDAVDMSESAATAGNSAFERRQTPGRRSATVDTNMSTSASTESSGKAAGKQKVLEGRPPGPRLPPQLRATLMAEKDLPGQEMRSEALLQRFILSHPATLPVTPRIQRGGRGRMFSFSRTNSDSSRSSSVGNSSDDDGPFAVDEALESDDGRGRAVGGPSGWDSSKMEVEMMHLGGGGGEGSVTSISDAGSGMAVDGPPSVRKTPYGRPSMSGLNGFGHMAVDEMGGGNGGLSGSPRGDQHIAPSMLWRESPSNHGRPNKRKAISEDPRFEPYTKRLRQMGDTPGSGGSGHVLSHHPSMHMHAPASPGLNPTSVSPSSAEAVEINPPNGGGQGRAIAYARSRAGSPSAASVSLAMRAISPVASSPLSNGISHANQNRPIIGMGGLGMLLLSKRNANAMSVGMGLMSDGDGDSTAVAEGIGGMDVEDEDENMGD